MLNPPPFGSPCDVNGGNISGSWMQWFNRLFKSIQAMPDYSDTAVVTVANGFAYTVPKGVAVVTLTPSAALGSGIVTMPPNPQNGDPFELSSTQDVTIFTLLPNAGQVVSTVPTTLVAGVGFSYYYHSLTATWLRRY